MSDLNVDSEESWFYESNGQRNGPISKSEIVALIKSSIITSDTPIWKQGFPGWLRLEDTDLARHLDKNVPPPLVGDHINNTVVWVLAFAPLIGTFLAGLIAGIIAKGNEAEALYDLKSFKYTIMIFLLNTALSIIDEKQLKKAGHNTNKFKGWVWLVPVYLYQRARATKQNLSYFIVWIICFLLIFLQ